MLELFQKQTIQACFTFGMIGILMVFFKRSLSRFISFEELPKVFPYLRESSRSFGEAASVVNVGLFIHSFPEFNMENGSFTVNGTVWFEFNASQLSIEVLEKFEFFEGTITNKSVAQIKRINDKIFVAYNFTVSFISTLNHKKFPLSDHRIFLIIKNEELSISELIFSVEPKDFNITPGIYPAGWKFKRELVETGYIKRQLSHVDLKKIMFVPVVIFGLEFSKPGFRQLLLTIIPSLLLFYLGLFSLVIPSKSSTDNTALTIAIGSISALIFNRIVIEDVSPKVGYFTVVDYTYLMFLGLIFIAFVFHIFSMEGLPFENVKLLSFYLFQIIILTGFQYLLKGQKKKYEGTKQKFSFFPRHPFKKEPLLSFLSLTEYEQYAAFLEEFPSRDNKDTLFPDYTEYLEMKSMEWKSNKWMYKTEKIAKYTPNHCALLFKKFTKVKKGEISPPHVLAHTIDEGDTFYIWGNLQGAFHSLIRTLSHLKSQEIIDDGLAICKPNHYFVFNGNAIGRSPHNLETLSVLITLLLKNPNQVIYLKGEEEKKGVEINFFLRRELECSESAFVRSSKTQEAILSAFFHSLPEGLYLKGIDISTAISPSHFPPMSESTLKEGFKEKTPFIKLDRLEKGGGSLPIPIIVRIICADSEKSYKNPGGVDLLPPEEGATTWSIFSGPTSAHREYFNFHWDAYGILSMGKPGETKILTSVTRDLEGDSTFEEKSFNLISGKNLTLKKPIKEHFIKQREIRIGTTLDLTQASRILGERLKRGLDLRIRKANREGEIKRGFVRIFFSDDKYNPSETLKNVLIYIDEKKTSLILSPLGTPTTKVLLPQSQNDQILILFPYTGANILRDPKLSNIIHYRASYSEEAQALVRYAHNSLFKQRFAFFYQDDDYGLAPLRASKKILLEDFKLSPDAICEASYQRNTVNVSNAVKIVEQYNPDVLFFFSTYSPSRTFIEKLGIQKLANATLMGISFLTDRFRDFASGSLDSEQQGKGLTFIISRVVPNPENVSIEIVKEYQEEMMREYPLVRFDVDSLEGYINASILLHVLKHIDPPYTHGKIMQQLEELHHEEFKGLMLNFDPETRCFSKDVWLDLGDGTWIYQSPSAS